MVSLTEALIHRCSMHDSCSEKFGELVGKHLQQIPLLIKVAGCKGLHRSLENNFISVFFLLLWQIFWQYPKNIRTQSNICDGVLLRK